MEIFKGILFFTLLIAPLLFQVLFGSSLISFNRRMKFWIVCVISVLLVFVTSLIHTEIISHNLAKHEIRDGLPFVGLFFLEITIMVAVALTILIQVLVKNYKSRKRSC